MGPQSDEREVRPPSGELGPFALVARLAEESPMSVWRAIDRRTGAPVILKRLDRVNATAAALERLRREYEVLTRVQGPGVIEVIDLETVAGDLVMVLVDSGGESLARRLQRGSLTIDEALEIASRLAEILARVHDLGYVHGDVNPNNVVIRAPLEVELIDFDFAFERRRGRALGDAWAGTLAYLAPEQTGRTTTPVDHRADLYSLGATLFEVVSGRPPFASTRAADLLRDHVATRPASLTALRDDVPASLAELVDKLLAKDPDERYSSAAGLLWDLVECRRRLHNGEREPFPLGTRGRAVELHAGLIGREEELFRLQDTWRRVVRERRGEVALVRGPRGIGKSALTAALARRVTSAWWGRGACEADAGELAPSVLYEALRDLCRQALTLGPAELAALASRCARRLGAERHVLEDMIPELRALLGAVERRPASSSELPRRARGDAAIVALLAAFADERPICLELDRLQRADDESIALIARVTEGCAALPVLALAIVGDDDAASDRVEHALRRRGRSRRVTTLRLEPLTRAAVTSIVAATLHRGEDDVAALADVLHRRSGGNPLLLRELVRACAEQGMIRAAADGQWRWELARIAEVTVAEELGVVLAARLGALGGALRRLVAIAAQIGDSFTAELVAAAAGLEPARADASLRVAADLGLLRREGARYRFLHDAVRLTARALLDPQELASVHLALARALRATVEPSEGGVLPALARHYHLGASALVDRGERRSAAWIIHAAGRRALQAGAFASAEQLFARARVMLPSDADAVDHPRTAALLLSCAEAASLSGRPEEAEAIFTELLASARDPAERARLRERRVDLDLHRGEWTPALRECVTALGECGVTVRASARRSDVIVELARVRLALAHRSPEQLLAQPSLVEPGALLIARLFYKASGAAFIVDPQMSAICALRLIRRDGGLTVYSAAAFATYSLLLGQVLSDLRGMERYGQLALALLERRPDAGVSILVHFLYGGMIGFWSRPLRECAEHLRIACARGEELGDLTLTIAARGLLVFNLLSSGAPLGEVARAAEEARRVAHRARHGATVANMTLILRVVHALQEPASGELSLSGDGLDEDAMTVEYKGLRAKLPRISVTHLRAFALMTLGRAREALPLIEAIHAKGRRRLINSYWVVEHAFLRALALVDAADRAAPIPRARLLWQIERERRRLRRWAQSCPANVTAKLALVEAELARLRGDHVASPRRYEASIRAAIDHDLGHDEALARERAAGYYLERGFDEIGALHLRSARLAHDRWGAAAKVELLERHHAGILRARDDTPGSERASRTGTRTRGATHVSGSEIDLDSVLEAAEFFARSDELDRILQGAIEALVACASASRGGLILADVGHLKLRALLDPDLGASAQALDQRLEEADAVPRSLIHLSYRTSEVVVVGDVGDSPLAARDPYFTRQRVRAAACFPLALAREGAALGVIYLENTLTPRAFTAARVRVISALASQLAIAVERVRLLRALREATQVAEEASAAKSSFLLRLSHELRTPLNVIIGYGDYLRELREDDEELVEITSAIQSSGRRLLESVSRVLDLTGAAAGDSRLAAAPVVVAALLAEARASIEPLLVDSRVTARVRCEPPDLVILADRYRLERIVAILAQNAAKFTREGAVALEARLSPDPDAATHVELTIIDTGIGISSEHHGQIFEAFTQVDGAVTREHEGLGLGLSVCRHFAAELGAQLEVESAPGQGSRFTVRLPYVPATR